MPRPQGQDTPVAEPAMITEALASSNGVLA